MRTSGTATISPPITCRGGTRAAPNEAAENDQDYAQVDHLRAEPARPPSRRGPLEAAGPPSQRARGVEGRGAGGPPPRYAEALPVERRIHPVRRLVHVVGQCRLSMDRARGRHHPGSFGKFEPECCVPLPAQPPGRAGHEVRSGFGCSAACSWRTSWPARPSGWAGNGGAAFGLKPPKEPGWYTQRAIRSIADAARRRGRGGGPDRCGASRARLPHHAAAGHRRGNPRRHAPGWLGGLGRFWWPSGRSRAWAGSARRWSTWASSSSFSAASSRGGSGSATRR